MEYLDLQPISRMVGSVVLPGSKSISNRTLLLAALADGTTEVRGLLASDDTQHMLTALQTLGVPWTQHGDSRDYSLRVGFGPAFHARHSTRPRMKSRQHVCQRQAKYILLFIVNKRVMPRI